MNGRILAAAGLAAVGLGVLFYLQANAAVGPESSFMYSDPDWAHYGLAIACAGAMAAVAGIVSRTRGRRAKPGG